MSNVVCLRNHESFTSISRTDRFDKPFFDGVALLAKLPKASPKLFALLAQIRELDKADYTRHKKLFKHVIFTDIRNSYGAKLIASVMIAAGYTLVQTRKGARVLPDAKLMRDNHGLGMMLLSTISIFNSKMDSISTREALRVFNQRPDNIYGQQCRFIVLDSVFKEGVDLFDVKYLHLMEKPMRMSDLIQAVGRARRFCGQAGLPFNSGWRLEVYNYILLDSQNKPVIEHSLKFTDTKQSDAEDETLFEDGVLELMINETRH